MMTITVEAQGENRIYVQYSGAVVRGVAHQGRAWYSLSMLLPSGKVDGLILEDSGNFLAYRSAVTSVIAQEATKAAREKLEPMIRAAALDWAKANGAALKASERAELARSLEAARDAVHNLEAQLATAKRAAIAAAAALSQFDDLNG